MTFAHNYRQGFDFITETLRSLPAMKNVEMKELVMPNGEIQRWFLMDGETLILKYRRELR